MISILEAAERHLLGKKPSTKQVYRRIAIAYHLFCTSIEIEWHQIRYHEVLAWLEFLRTKKGITSESGHSTYCNRTIRKHLVIIAALFRANRLDFTVFDAALRLVPVSLKPQKRITGYIPFDQVLQLFAATTMDGPGARNRAYMALCFGGALRTSEAVNLKMGDIKKTEKGTLYVHLADSKTNQAAHQIIAPSLVEHLEDYRAQRIRDGATPSDPFLSGYNPQATRATNQKLGTKRMLEVFWKLTQEVLGKELGTHSMRATAITKLIADGVPHRKIQDFSRHATVSMVELYDKAANDIETSPAKKMSFE